MSWYRNLMISMAALKFHESLLPEESVGPIVVYEFSESFLDDPDGTFLYYITMGL